MPVLPSWLAEPLWVQVEALLPERPLYDPAHPLGCHSGNSSLPPSSDTFVKPDKKQTPARGRRRGGQPGSPGVGLAMVADPDQVEDHLPAGCGGCGGALSQADSLGFVRRQVRDIPLVTVTVTEHRAHRCRCSGCGHLTSVSVPEQVAGSPTSYGPNLRALAAYLLVFQHIPVERTAHLIADVTGARVSTGWVASVLEQAADQSLLPHLGYPCEAR